jgi:uncharacterized protein YbaP (TraB family)
MRRRVEALRGLLPLVAWLACASPPPPAPPPPSAFYWHATSPEGGSLFLLGSVHIGDGRELALPPQVADDWARSEALVVEADPHRIADLERLESFDRYGLLPPTQTLRDVVGADTWQALLPALRDARYPVEAASRMRPWMLAQMLMQIEFAVAGYDPENGVDAWFLRRAAAERRPVLTLETLDEQLASFGLLSPAAEERLLLDMLEQRDAFMETTHEILRAWERGDEAQLLERVLGIRDDPLLEEFHRTVFVERNRRMAERLVGLADDGRRHFVVVGTGHLIGPESIPVLLAARGLRIERMADAFLEVLPLELEIPESIPVPVAQDPEGP